jgi:predicted transcriptional regulator
MIILFMKTLCELMSLEVLPTVRAMIAKRLVENHGLSQQRAAERLGTTQPAISQYKRELRGFRTSMLTRDQKLTGIIDSIAKRLASGEIDQQEAALEFCEICRHMRSTGAACELHRKINPSLESCSLCDKLQC